MTKLSAMRDITRTKQDADIAVKFGLLALSGTTQTTVLSMLRRVPPKFLRHAFLGIDVSVDRFLVDAQFGTYLDHAVSDLFGCPPQFDLRHNHLAQLEVPDQFALRRSTLVRLKQCSMTEVASMLLGQGIVGPEISFDLTKERRFVAFQDASYLSDGHLGAPPGLDLTTFLQ